jgi:hypothetical protein
LEYYCLFQDGVKIPSDDIFAQKFIPKKVKELANAVAKEKIDEFTKFNNEVFTLIYELFSKFESEYNRIIKEISE